MNAFKNAVERLRAKTERTIGISELDRGDAQALIVQFDHDGQEIERLKARVAQLEADLDGEPARLAAAREEQRAHDIARSRKAKYTLTGGKNSLAGAWNAGIESAIEGVMSTPLDATPLRARVAELEAWQLTVAEATGYVNRPEGQAGYEVADAHTVAGAIERWRQEAAK